jgi:hypothetical protein
MKTSVLAQGVQMGKSPNGVEMERPDRGLLADQDHQRAIWTSRARRFTSMAMVVDFLTAILALVAGGIINRWGLVAFVYTQPTRRVQRHGCEHRGLTVTAGWRNAAGCCAATVSCANAPRHRGCSPATAQ